ncbi:MAG TPA: TOBE domain-containing protein [Candidatus Deferrimicrobiaceae bacterium]
MSGRQRSPNRPPIRLSGAVWIRGGRGTAIGDDRIGLLERIDRLGSISKAAKAAGISYKTAWDVIDEVNNLSPRPLVVRTSGGRMGGGTVLTDEGKEVVRLYRVIEGEHRRFLRGLEGKAGPLAGIHPLLTGVAMRVSARNVFLGTIAWIRKGAVNSEVLLRLRGEDALCSVITNESVESLGLAVGQEAYAFFKASSVILGKDLHAARVSARNVLCGKVERVKEGPVSAEVTVRLPGGSTVTAVITEESARQLAFLPGDHACALVKASNVIMGVAG